MKMIIFLVLAGLSLAAGDTDPGSRWQCLFDGLETTPTALQKLAEFICKYRGKFDGNVENYKNAFAEVKDTLEKLTCYLDEVLGTDATIEDIGGDAAKAAEHAGSVVLRLTGGLGLNEAATDLLCELAGGVLTSDCWAAAIATKLPAVITAIDDTFCKTYKDAELARKVIELLREVGCLADDITGSGETVENLVTNLGKSLEDLLKPIIGTLKGLDTNVPGGLTCKVVDILSGQSGAGGVLAGGLPSSLG
ncbi:ranaspumin-like [Dendrobates tinctorius]|uniref:ranaspumin-like n=1 Tax=Dendrobates tinctorius TaxID=92724 RepID=UPI003CC97CC9